MSSKTGLIRPGFEPGPPAWKNMWGEKKGGKS